MANPKVKAAKKSAVMKAKRESDIKKGKFPLQTKKNKKIDIAMAFEMKFGEHQCTDTEIGAYFDCSRNTVNRALHPYVKLMHNAGTLKAEAKNYRSKKSELLDLAELKLLSETMNDDKIENASLNNVAYALNTVSNMNKLEKGEATANISYVDMSKSLADLQAERKQIMERLDMLGGGVEHPEDAVEAEVVDEGGK